MLSLHLPVETRVRDGIRLRWFPGWSGGSASMAHRWSGGSARSDAGSGFTREAWLIEREREREREAQDGPVGRGYAGVWVAGFE